MYSYKVPDMSCGHCVAAITGAIKDVDPTAEVEADLDSGRVTVSSKADAARIEAAMREAGYPSEPLAA